MAEKRLSELDALTTPAPGDLYDTSEDNGDTTYTSKKITFANMSTGIASSSALANIRTTSFGITIDNGVSDITTGLKGYAVIPYAGTIRSWRIVATTTGSIVIDIWKANNAIPTAANTITGTEKPTLASQQINSDTSLGSWTTSISVGDVIGFNVDSGSGVNKVTLTIEVEK